MKHKQRHIFLLLGIFLPGLLFAQSLKLREALQLAEVQNEKILQQQENVAQKIYAEREAWGNFLPSVTLQASLTHLNDPMVIDLNPIRTALIQMQAGNQTEFANIYRLLQGQAPLSDPERAAYFQGAVQQLDGVLPEFTETFKEQDYRTATIVGVQPLFLGGKLWAAKKFAGAETRAARAEAQLNRNQVLQETANRYFQVALLQEVVRTRQNLLDGIRRHKAEAQRLVDEGLIARYHLLRAAVAVADAERALLQDQNNLELARLALRHTLALNDTTSIYIAESLHFADFTAPFPQLKEQAVTAQPALHLVAAKKVAAGQKLTVARSEFLPRVAAFGKYELYPEYLSSLEPRWAIGLQLSFNLFNGFKNYQQIQSAKHLKRQVQYMEQQTRRQVDLWLEKAWREMQNARERYLKSAADLSLAQENVRLNEKRFHSGLGTSLEVIDARLMLQKVEVERLAALYDYYQSLTQLCAATGDTKQILAIWEKEEN